MPTRHKAIPVMISIAPAIPIAGVIFGWRGSGSLVGTAVGDEVAELLAEVVVDIVIADAASLSELSVALAVATVDSSERTVVLVAWSLDSLVWSIVDCPFDEVPFAMGVVESRAALLVDEGVVDAAVVVTASELSCRACNT